MNTRMRAALSKSYEHKVYPYPCGYDPRGKPLKQVVQHWRTCSSAWCREMARDWEPLKRDLIRKFKNGNMGVPSDVPPARG